MFQNLFQMLIKQIIELFLKNLSNIPAGAQAVSTLDQAAVDDAVKKTAEHLSK